MASGMECLSGTMFKQCGAQRLLIERAADDHERAPGGSGGPVLERANRLQLGTDRLDHGGPMATTNGDEPLHAQHRVAMGLQESGEPHAETRELERRIDAERMCV